MKQLTLSINSKDHILGNPNATLELIEYGDYECPFCGRAYPILKDIKQKLDGDIKFVFRNFPLSKIHPHAFMAAVATEAAALQGKFWEMHDIVFENQKSLDEENIFRFASLLGLDTDRFREDLQDKLLVEKVEKDFESGLRSGVNRTPSFFINGNKYEGDYNIQSLSRAIKSAITQKA